MGRFLSKPESAYDKFYSVKKRCNGLVPLHGTGTGGGTGNRAGTMGNNGSWFFSLSRINVTFLHNVLEYIYLVSGPCPILLQCEYTVKSKNITVKNTLFFSE